MKIIKELFTSSEIKTEHSKLWHYSYFLKVIKILTFYLSFISFVILIIYQKTTLASKTGFHYPSVIKMPPSGQYTLLSNITLSLLLIALFLFLLEILIEAFIGIVKLKMLVKSKEFAQTKKWKKWISFLSLDSHSIKEAEKTPIARFLGLIKLIFSAFILFGIYTVVKIMSSN